MKWFLLYPLLVSILLCAETNTILAAELSYSKIKSLYNEGELDKMRDVLESFLKKSGKTAQTKEKVFAYKYLGVAYAAQPDGYPVAETYFYQMLKLAPNAHLSDMYVSSEIESLFNRTQARFQKENRDISEFDEFGNRRKPPDTVAAPVAIAKDSTHPVRPNRPSNADSIPSRQPSPKKESSLGAWPWLVGGGAVLIAGGFYWYLSQEKKTRDHVTDASNP